MRNPGANGSTSLFSRAADSVAARPSGPLSWSSMPCAVSPPPHVSDQQPSNYPSSATTSVVLRWPVACGCCCNSTAARRLKTSRCPPIHCVCWFSPHLSLVLCLRLLSTVSELLKHYL